VADRRPSRVCAARPCSASRALDEVERFNAKWDMTVERRGAAAVIEGPALAVEGSAAITAIYRR
jgi:hypothetical protein